MTMKTPNVVVLEVDEVRIVGRLGCTWHVIRFDAAGWPSTLSKGLLNDALWLARIEALGPGREASDLLLLYRDVMREHTVMVHDDEDARRAT